MLARVARYVSMSFLVSADSQNSHGQMKWNQNLPEEQCIFVRGLRATRILGILPRLRGAAEPNQSPDEGEFEPDMHLITTPGDSDINVMPCISRFITLFDVSRSIRTLLTRSWSLSLRWVILRVHHVSIVNSDRGRTAST